MAQRVFTRTVTVPAGTAIATPLSVDISFNQSVVETVEIVIPDGHAGFTGIALQQAHQQVIPEEAGTWLISNDEKIIFAIEDFIDNGNWQAVMYNTDVYDHSFYLRFLGSNITPSFGQAGVLPTVAVITGPVTGQDTINTGVAPPAPAGL